MKKKIMYLDYACKIGERVQWKNLKGEVFVGILLNMDENYLATVKLDNGEEVEFQC